MSDGRGDYDELWAADRWCCKITCAAGHGERLIDRLTVDDDGDGALRLSDTPLGERLPPHRDRSTLVTDFEGNPDVAERYRHHVLRCPSCSVEVRIGAELLGQLARGLHEAGRDHLDLRSLAAILSRQ
jgi:hypothetical protein